MHLQRRIETKLAAAFDGAHIDVINESHGHNVPANSETHFRVIVVTRDFDGVSRVARHRQINGLLADELADGVHALAIEARTPVQWAAAGGPTLTAPACRGGSKHDPLMNP